MVSQATQVMRAQAAVVGTPYPVPCTWIRIYTASDRKCHNNTNRKTEVANYLSLPSAVPLAMLYVIVHTHIICYGVTMTTFIKIMWAGLRNHELTLSWPEKCM